MRYLGVDPGGRRIGLAIGDDVTGIVTPLTVACYRGAAAAALEVARHADHHDTRQVVVGLPIGADGQETPACRRSHQLARELERLGLEVVLQPEFLSSNEARRRAREVGIRARQPIDHIAAQVLLEEYLAG